MAPIIIDLDSTGKVSDEPDTGIRQKVLLEVLRKLYERMTPEADASDARNRRPTRLDVMPFRRHDAILVSARRGDGKTTFLADVLNVVQKVQDGTSIAHLLPAASNVATAVGLYSLGLIDPTLIENKQHIMILIMERIRAAVDRAYRMSRETSEGEHADFQKCLVELASGLTSLDGVGDRSAAVDWADAEYVLDQGLGRAEAASGFERAFHHFVEAACRFVRVDGFVLAIDDVDTWFERGWPVLEALRKYLVTPRLKVIMAGDMNLYNILVRQEQWKQMANASLDVETRAGRGTTHLSAVVDAVNTLQDQYLIKVARPENRVYLRPLLHTTDEEEVLFRASRPERQDIPENVVSKRFASRLLALSANEDVRPIRSTMFRLPLRSSLQALSGAWGVLSADDPRKVGRDGIYAALEALRYVVSARLMVHGLDETELANPQPERILGTFGDWMTRRSLWGSMARLHPDGANDDADVVAIFVAAILVDVFRRHPKLMIDYWLRICTIREMVDASEVDQGEQLTQLAHHVKATTNEKAPHFISRLAAWDARGGRQVARGIRVTGASVAALRLKEPNSVVWQLYGSRSLDREGVSKIMNGPDETLRRRLVDAMPAPLRGYHEALQACGRFYAASGRGEAGLAGSLANSTSTVRECLVNGSGASFAWAAPALEVSSSQRSSNGVYSFPRLLAVLGELLDSASEGPVTAGEVGAVLARYSHLRSYPAPSTASPATDDDDSDDAEQDASFEGAPEQDVVEPPDDFLVPALVAWLSSYDLVRDDAVQAPLHLGRIWTRYSYAFASIREKLKHGKTRYLGVLMHRQIVAFLHAVGVESLRGAGRVIGAKVIDNPVESSEPFLALLQSLDPEKGRSVAGTDPRMAFFRFMFSCPLWGYFLARRDEDIVGRPVRLSPTAALFARYAEAVAGLVGRDPDFTVLLLSPAGGAPARFDGLFHVLNTVPFQGFPKAAGRAVADPPPMSGLDRVVEDLSRELDAAHPDAAPPTRGHRSIRRSGGGAQ